MKRCTACKILRLLHFLHQNKISGCLGARYYSSMNCWSICAGMCEVARFLRSWLQIAVSGRVGTYCGGPVCPIWDETDGRTCEILRARYIGKIAGSICRVRRTSVNTVVEVAHEKRAERRVGRVTITEDLESRSVVDFNPRQPTLISHDYSWIRAYNQRCIVSQ